MDKLPPPEKIEFASPKLASRWQHWKEEFKLYAELAMSDKDDTVKAKMCLYLIGTTGREIYETIKPVPAAGAVDVPLKIGELLTLFDAYCNPKQNETVERYKFFTRFQEPGEQLDRYITDLKVLAQTCNFETLHDSLVRDRIVCGITNSALRERLLRAEKLTLKSCEDMCQSAELSRERIRTIETKTEVHALRQSGQEDRLQKCKYCGNRHVFGKYQCPAFGKTCSKCDRKNHFAAQCRTATRKASASGFQRSGPKRGKMKRKPWVNAVAEGASNVGDSSSESLSDDDYEDVNTVNLLTPPKTENNINFINYKQQSHIYADMSIDEVRVTFQIDSGATCNILPSSVMKKLGKHNIKQTSQVLSMYNGSTSKPNGKCKLKLVNPKNGRKYRVEFVIVNNDIAIPLLGSKAVQQMGLIEVRHENIAKPLGVNTIKNSNDGKNVKVVKKGQIANVENLYQEYNDVFEGIGQLEGEYKLQLDPNAVPVVHPPRRVPVAIRDNLKAELDRLVKQNIIKPVSEPTPWVSSLVTVVKPGKMRICIDPRDLNKSLMRSHYPMPTLEDILPDLNKAQVFSVFDAKHGFWHVKLDNESSLLTTFNTPFGRYRWLRLPFGLNAAPEEFQRRQHQALEGLPGVKCIVDDVIVYGEGPTKEAAIRDHDQKVRNLMDRCREKNLRLNRDKVKFRTDEVSFMGHLITSQGLKPDPRKVEAVINMPRPTDVQAVRRFIGFVTYLSKFLPKLSDACEPMRKLTLKDTEWSWHEVHDKAFNNIKSLVTSQPVLSYYDSEKELTLQSDASESGLGATIMQDGHPIAFASRALSDVETRYAQIEKELLSVIFGLERFHQYTYGRRVTVQTDHKPLESIVCKPLYKAPKRLQRMLLRLQRYDVALGYRPGNQMQLADTLSRAYLPGKPQSHTSREVESVNMVYQLPITDARKQAIQAHTTSDSTLQTLITIIHNGWPQSKNYLPQCVTPYYQCRDELTVQDGVVIRGERVVVPKTLRREMLDKIHSSHLGIDGCLRRARECLYWPGMNAELKDYIQTCDVCASVGTNQPKEPLMPHAIEQRPWSKVGVDLFHVHDRNYVVTVDYFSGFWEIDFLQDTTSNCVIHKLKGQFARHGIPDVCMSDNGPQFSSYEFKQFARDWEFRHATSSPGFPQSNGRAEQAVKMAKSLITKAKKAKKDPYLAILAYRNTPSQNMDSSPAQRLFSRRTKTLLPTSSKLLKPAVPIKVTEQIKSNKARQAYYHDKGSHSLPTLSIGDTVRIMPPSKRQEWQKAIVQNQVSPRSYEVMTENRRVYRRNRKHLRHTKETYTPNPEPLETVEQEITQTEPHTQNPHTARDYSDRLPQQTRSGRVTRVPSYLRDYTT